MDEKGMSFRQAWLWQVMDGKASLSQPEGKHLLSRESLLDAATILFDECFYHQRTEHIRKFVDIYKNAINEVRSARVSLSDFQVAALVGRGQFGKVELVRVKEGANDAVYALKTIPKKVATDSMLSMSVWEERDLLTRANSPWLIQAHCAFQDAANLYLVMDFLPGGDLLSLMHRQEDIFTEENVRFYFSEILLAAYAVHHIGYVHRDIKPENVLLDHRGHIKLVDFGSAVKIGSSGRSVGTKAYMSPEALEAAGPGSDFVFGPELDFWSLGIILYEMLYFRNPFEPEDDTPAVEVIRNVLNWQKSLVFDEEIFQISPECRSLIQDLITSADQRFCFEQITDHPFMASVRLSQMSEMTPPFIPKLSGNEDISNFEPPPPPPKEDVKDARSSFANGDCLSQVAFLGFAHSSEQERMRRPRARTSLAVEGLPVAALERKMAERAAELGNRCRELEERKVRLEAELRLQEERKENAKDDGNEKASQDAVHSPTQQRQQQQLTTFSEEREEANTEEGYATTSKLRTENAKLKRLIAGLNLEIEDQRARMTQYREAAARHGEAENRWRERCRDLESRLRSATRRRSQQARRLDEGLAEEHRQMLSTIREQADAIASLESSRQSLLHELQESQMRNETLEEELRTAPSTAEKRSRIMMVAPPLFELPDTPTGTTVPAGTITSTPMQQPQASPSTGDRDRALSELGQRVADLVAEVAAARQEQRQMESRWSAKEEELRAAVEEREQKLLQAAEDRKLLQQKYERMCIEKIEKYDENRVLKTERRDFLEKTAALRDRAEVSEAAAAAADNACRDARERLQIVEEELKELTRSCERLQEEARETLQLRSMLAVCESKSREREEDLHEKLETARRETEAVQAESRERKVALSEALALLASSRQREKVQREMAEASARRAEQLRGEASGAAQQQEETLHELRTKYQQLNYALEEAERALHEARRDREKTSARVSSLAAAKDVLESRCRSLELDMSRLRDEENASQEKKVALEMRLAQLTSQLESERAFCREKISTAGGENQKRLAELRERLRAEGNEWKARCDELDAKVAQLNIEVSQLTRDKQNLSERLEVTMKKAKFSEDETIRLKEECAQHITSLQHLRRENLDLQRELDAAEEGYDVVSGAKADLEAQLQAKEHEFSVERFRASATIQQQGKLIDMLKGNVENVGQAKRKGIKHLFGGASRPALGSLNASATPSSSRYGNGTLRETRP